MKIDLDYKFGQSIFIKNDDEQREYLLHRIILEPKGRVVLELFTAECEIVEVPETYITKERDVLKATGATEKDKEED